MPAAASVLVALVAVVATAVQAWSSVIELGRANREAAHWIGAEDDLVAEQRPWRRRATRRLLKAERGAELHREIRRVELTLASWVALTAVAAYALAVAALDLAA